MYKRCDWNHLDCHNPVPLLYQKYIQAVRSNYHLL